MINQEGIIRAQGLAERNGEIILEGGYVAQTGTLDASGKQGGKCQLMPVPFLMQAKPMPMARKAVAEKST